MDKNKKGNFIVLLAFIIFAVILIIILTVLSNRQDDAKPLPGNIDKENTTTTTEDVDDAPVIATNFSASLDTILNGLLLVGDYEETFRYSGAKFSFNCTKFNIETNKCDEGSALMDVGTSMIPLYTYKNEEDNYYNRQDDYYIILSDDYIILATAHTLKEMGVSKIYDRSGKFLSEVDNLLFGYKHGEQDVPYTYSALSDDNKYYYYYTCDKNKVAIAKYDLVNLKYLGIDEIIDDGTCN